MRTQFQFKENRLLQTPAGDATLRVSKLAATEQAEVIRFLSQRPDRTFGLLGFIHGNGLISAHNRGTFYACRDARGELQGVALIGHHLLFEARNEAVIAAFARLAQQCPAVYMLLGDHEDVQTFWSYYAPGGAEARLFCRQLMLEQRWPSAARAPVAGLRLARPDDLELIVPVHAQMVFEECGDNPLRKDAEAFRSRCLRRIENRQTWVLIEGGRLIFKSDVFSDTPELIYLEGVWVNATERGKGYGKRCLSQLTGELLTHSRAICVLVNESRRSAQDFYCRNGFATAGVYDTIFLDQKIC
ncbi:MAG TPA: GNAT family N-acetyltransferase [Blastocatellia bacterium]|nr:GNAT family N-acetyltransferase [Blastocatellia bacterium]